MERTRRVPGRLSTLSEYELRHLGRHLAASANSRNLRLLLHLDDGGSNAWFAAKLAIDDLDGYHSDLGAAWRMADSRGTVGEHVGYALIAASVTGMARELPADLLATMVAYGVVSSSYAVESVRQVPDAALQADMICAVAPHLSDEHRQLLLELARGIAAGPVRARALAALAPYVPAQLTVVVVAEVLAGPPSGAWQFDEPAAWLRTGVLAGIAPVVVDLDRQDPTRRFTASLLRLVRGLADDGAHGAEWCVALMATLIPHLDGKLARVAITEALRVARAITDVPTIRRKSMVYLLPYLPRGRRRLLLIRWWLATVNDSRHRIELLAGIVAAGPERDKALSRLLRHLSRNGILTRLSRLFSPEDFVRLEVDAVGRVAPYVRPGSQAASALLGLVQAIDDDGRRAEGLSAIVHLAPADQQEELAVAVTGHHSGGHMALVRVAPLLPAHMRQHELQQAFGRVTRLNDDSFRVELLAELAVCHDDQSRREAVRNVLTATIDQCSCECDTVFACLAPVLDMDDLDVALDHAAMMSTEQESVDIVLALARYLPVHLLERAVDIALAADDTAAVLDLLPHLPEERQHTVLIGLLDSCQVPGSRERLDVVVRIAPLLPEPLRTDTIERALGIVREREYHVGDGWVLRDLALLLPDDRQPVLLELTRRLDHAVARYDALRGLASVLAEPLVPEAITLAREDWFRDAPSHYSGEVLAALLPRVPEPMLDEALELIEHGSRKDEDWRATALAALSHRLSPARVDRAFTIALGLRGYARATALVGLFPCLRQARQAEALSLLGDTLPYTGTEHAKDVIPPHLSRPLWPNALAFTDRIDEKFGRGAMLAAFAPHLPREHLPSFLDRVGRLAQRADTLGEIAPHLPPESLPHALRIAVRAGSDADRGDSLANLAPYLTTEELRTAALKAVTPIEDVHARATAATALAVGAELVTALLDVSRIDHGDRRTALLRDLAPRLPGHDIVPWRQVLEVLARRGRDELLGDLQALAGALGWQDDPALAHEVFDAVGRCGRWWP